MHDQIDFNPETTENSFSVKLLLDNQLTQFHAQLAMKILNGIQQNKVGSVNKAYLVKSDEA